MLLKQEAISSIRVCHLRRDFFEGVLFTLAVVVLDEVVTKLCDVSAREEILICRGTPASLMFENTRLSVFRHAPASIYVRVCVYQVYAGLRMCERERMYARVTVCVSACHSVSICRHLRVSQF